MKHLLYCILLGMCAALISAIFNFKVAVIFFLILIAANQLDGEK